MKTKKEFQDFFKTEILPHLGEKPGPGIDRPMRREAWNNTIDGMLRDGELPKRAEEWACPW